MTRTAFLMPGPILLFVRVHFGLGRREIGGFLWFLFYFV